MTQHHRVNQTVALTATPTLSLSTSRDGDWAASLGSPWRCLITLSLEEFRLISSLTGLPAALVPRTRRQRPSATAGAGPSDAATRLPCQPMAGAGVAPPCAAGPMAEGRGRGAAGYRRGRWRR